MRRRPTEYHIAVLHPDPETQNLISEYLFDRCYFGIALPKFNLNVESKIASLVDKKFTVAQLRKQLPKVSEILSRECPLLPNDTLLTILAFWEVK